MEEQTIDIPRQTHEETTPVEATSDAGNRGVDESSLKQDLYKYATHPFDRRWPDARAIYDKFPDMVRIPLNGSKDTALHVAVMEYNSTFVKELVKYMTREDLEIRNADGNTAFCIAAMIGNIGDFFEIMIGKNENLPLTRGQDGMLPVHMAVLFGNHQIAQDLTSKNLLQKMDLEDIERLFFMTINSSMYDVAMKLLEKHPKELVVARNDREETAFHMLVRQPSEEFYMPEKNSNATLFDLEYFELVRELCSRVSKLEYHKILDLMTKPSVVLFDAVKSGNSDVVKSWLRSENRERLLTIKDRDTGQNLLHFAVLYRRRRIFYFILMMTETVNRIIREVDKSGNNVLHLAARKSEETSSSSSPNIQMQRELVWFKEVEKIVPPELRRMRNRDGKTPKDIFYASHGKLSNEVKVEAKGIANSGMVVAALIATVAFAAALTVPGDKNNIGWFIVFILTNAVALFTSSASIISFLSIFTSPKFTDSELILSMHPSLLLGLTLLFISIVSMVIAFAAASFLTFNHTNKWVAYVVASLGLLPILTFLVLQYSLFDALRDCLRFVLKRLREGTAKTSSS